MIFDFLQDLGYHEERKIDRFENGDLTIDTCRVSDGKNPYETAVMHPAYNSGAWVIVESYRSLEEARLGHDRWIKTMTAEKLPTALTDCRNSEISELIGVVGGTLDFEKGATK